MSIRFKVILPYLILTLLVAVTGVYVVTNLVADSLEERLTNQLLESGRSLADTMGRQEISHLEIMRIVAYTRGMSDAANDNDTQTVIELVRPLVVGLGIENLLILNGNGQELAHFIFNDDANLIEITEQTGAANLPLVASLLRSGDVTSLPTRGLGLNPVDARYYYYTAIPLPYENDMVGVVLVGTSLENLLPLLKSASLANVVFYGDGGQALAATFAGGITDKQLLNELSISSDRFQQVISSTNETLIESTVVQNRQYSQAFHPLQVGDSRIGVFSVALPQEFVLQPGAESRNTYVLVFSVAMVAVILIGLLIARLIIRPLSRLVQASLAVSQGDLSQRTGIQSADEIGVLANTFDEMTNRLQERTIELERTNRILEQMDRAKASFIQVSAHELRTPLTLMKGYSQMLEAKAQADPELDLLARGVLEGTERMTEVVNSMLDVSKIDSNLLKVSYSTVQLEILIKKVERRFTDDLVKRKLVIHQVGLEDLPIIQADPELLYKVYHHLIVNAIKYSPNGGVITITGKLIEINGKAPEIETAIIDQGIGIAPEHQELVFEKFYQTGDFMLHSSSKTAFKGGGPGLGLAIARGIIQAHRGRIWLQSPGYDEETCPGTTFFVRLPVRKDWDEAPQG